MTLTLPCDGSDPALERVRGQGASRESRRGPTAPYLQRGGGVSVLVLTPRRPAHAGAASTEHVTEGRSRTGPRVVGTLLGVLAGGALNAALGDQGADTPALALLGGGLALGVVLVVQPRRRAREAPDD